MTFSALIQLMGQIVIDFIFFGCENEECTFRIPTEYPKKASTITLMMLTAYFQGQQLRARCRNVGGQHVAKNRKMHPS